MNDKYISLIWPTDLVIDLIYYIFQILAWCYQYKYFEEFLELSHQNSNI